MRPLRTTVVLLAAALAFLVPAVAFACTIPIRTIGPLDISRADLRYPVERKVTRDAWGVDTSWRAVLPSVDQFVKIRNGVTVHGASYRTQRAISIDARGPEDNGWMYFDDDLESTPPCQLTGQIEWQRPRVRVRQSSTEVRILAASQRTVGDRTGCILGPDHGIRPCPNLTRTIARLAAPLGNRKLVLEQFPGGG
jgi:hypothetical protein